MISLFYIIKLGLSVYLKKFFIYVYSGLKSLQW